MKSLLDKTAAKYAYYQIEVLLGHCKKQRKTKLGFEVHLADHCNLKCAGCGHFSSIAEEQFAETDIFENDLIRISNLTKGDIRYIALLGGEPLLNKDIDKFMEISRKYFKDAYIFIVTNGILLDKMEVAFWETARKNDIWIGISPYPIKLDIDSIKQFSKQYGVPCGFYQGFGIIDFGGLEDSFGKKMFRWVFDLKGRQNYKVNFMMCDYANNCVTLKTGKLYTCALLPHIEHFNKYFRENLETTERDYIEYIRREILMRL